jgi:hypothetical protein
MKFRIMYTINNPVLRAAVETPNTPAVVEATCIQDVLSRLALNMPQIEKVGLEYTGVRVEVAEDEEESHDAHA